MDENAGRPVPPEELREAITGSELEEPKGRPIAVLSGRIALYDGNPDDVSRAGTPLMPDEPTVKAIEEKIAAAMSELGFTARVELTRTDK